MDLEEQTSVGEALVRHLVRVQLRASLLLTGVTVLVLCGLPALFWAVPRLAAMTVFGVRIPWLVLGVLPFPFLILMGYLSTRAAERHERDFVHLVES